MRKLVRRFRLPFSIFRPPMLEPTLPRTMSLADVEPGEEVVVRRVVFEQVRVVYPLLLLRPGERVRCHGATSLHLMLRTASGARLSVDRFFACFVEVEHTSGRRRRAGRARPSS